MHRGNRSRQEARSAAFVTLALLFGMVTVTLGVATPHLRVGLPPDDATATVTPTTEPSATPDLSTPIAIRDAYGRVNIYMPIVGRSVAEEPRVQAVEPEPTRTPSPRRTRVPEPTAAPKWPPSLTQPGASKLGIHVIRNNSPDIMQFIRVTKPAVVKAVDDLHWLVDVKEASPETVTVGRINDTRTDRVGDPAEAARAFVAAHLDQYKFNSGVDYWEGWNEPDPNEEMSWYAQFEAERARVMASYGFKVAVGGFSTGVPEWNEFIDFLPAIEAAKKYGGILTLHEYSAPTLDYGMGAGIPGRPSRPDRGALTLRYRFWYQDLLKARGLDIPLVISEAGIDGLVNPTGLRGLGWKDFQRYWSTKGMGGYGDQVYIDQLVWYDSQLRQDPYVIGFTVFTAGAQKGEWQSYDVTDILPQIAQYVVSQH